MTVSRIYLGCQILYTSFIMYKQVQIISAKEAIYGGFFVVPAV